jgi:peptidoglycan L-alanyl-D-glutamate endopeptidase CwlK
MSSSLDKLNTLHPKIRQSAIDAYNEAVKATPEGVHPVISQTTRTFEEQDALYAQGRTKPGNIVTQAQGGQSWHNFSLALDFVNLINGNESWNVDDNWMTVVNIFKNHGFTWGGNFPGSFKDYPHLENKCGLTLSEALDKHNNGQVDENGYILI